MIKIHSEKDAQVQHAYTVIVKSPFSDKLLYDNFGIISTDYNAAKQADGTFIYQFAALTDAHVTAMKSNANVVSVEPILQPVGEKTEHIVNGKLIVQIRFSL